MNDASERLTGLAPIIDGGIETLILGSFPSPVSLAIGQYYAHRQNQFWRIMAALIGEPLHELDYALRGPRLLAHRVGVWDVYRACRRQGALDAAIEAALINDFSDLKRVAPRLRCVGFNGQTAGRLVRLMNDAGYTTHVLPSTSPANTQAFACKLEIWRAAHLAD